MSVTEGNLTACTQEEKEGKEGKERPACPAEEKNLTRMLLHTVHSVRCQRSCVCVCAFIGTVMMIAIHNYTTDVLSEMLYWLHFHLKH